MTRSAWMAAVLALVAACREGGPTSPTPPRAAAPVTVDPCAAVIDAYEAMLRASAMNPGVWAVAGTRPTFETVSAADLEVFRLRHRECFR